MFSESFYHIMKIMWSDCRQRSNFKMRGWTFSMYKMKINVEISMIKAINMI